MMLRVTTVSITLLLGCLFVPVSSPAFFSRQAIATAPEQKTDNFMFRSSGRQGFFPPPATSEEVGSGFFRDRPSTYGRQPYQRHGPVYDDDAISICWLNRTVQICSSHGQNIDQRHF